MKQKVIQSLKKISEGSLTSFGSILIAIALILIVAAAFAAIPMLLIWGLQLLGFGIVTSFKSYCGAMLIMLFISYSKIGINRTSNTSKDN
jgi:hypothetical protein